MSRSGSKIGRRGFLRSAGAFLALPWLETFSPLDTARAGPAASPKQRLLFLMVPNGVHQPDWTIPSGAAGFELRQCAVRRIR